MANNRLRNIEKTLLSDNWYRLNKFSYDYQINNGDWVRQEREAYDRGNGAAILLYNIDKKSVVLTKQFRMPTYVNGNDDGYMIEVCAGLIDDEAPEESIRRETEEETGYRIKNVQKISEMYMSPGSVTEKLYFFVAQYDAKMKVSEGGGVATETEDIEVLELPFEETLKMMSDGTIEDPKTILLLQYAQIHGLMS